MNARHRGNLQKIRGRQPALDAARTRSGARDATGGTGRAPGSTPELSAHRRPARHADEPDTPPPRCFTTDFKVSLIKSPAIAGEPAPAHARRRSMTRKHPSKSLTLFDQRSTLSFPWMAWPWSSPGAIGPETAHTVAVTSRALLGPIADGDESRPGPLEVQPRRPHPVCSTPSLHGLIRGGWTGCKHHRQDATPSPFRAAPRDGDGSCRAQKRCADPAHSRPREVGR